MANSNPIPNFHSTAQFFKGLYFCGVNQEVLDESELVQCDCCEGEASQAEAEDNQWDVEYDHNNETYWFCPNCEVPDELDAGSWAEMRRNYSSYIPFGY